ncbi:tetratricopeptide repeat protein [Helicobacter cetorum]|uniref:Uncharacterized protein n=1 Tax=Helicobacter cetorum (strain ATCC BAA-540 / CCUG 52418 / MIT 99-5656) TaxID=1163745 RepID=I0ERR5_HELCM|nr:tetratricopeptide repeat protein [Helicobacter cetorum]AFI05634.1 hypothetical protein HCD_03090 [Helicobacter cetorum MIT 99-5656]
MQLETITLANIYEEQGFQEEALQIYTNILKKNPNHKEALKHVERLAKVPKDTESTNENTHAYLKKDFEPVLNPTLEEHYLNFIKGSGLSLNTLEKWLVEWN